MLRLSASLYNQPIMSLRVGGRVGTAVSPIINPHNLKIVGWWCQTNGHNQNVVLLSEDVREKLSGGLAINDEETLALPEDLVRHKEVLSINFQLMDKPVRTKRQKLGRVEDFSYNDGLFVQKLYVGRPLVKVLSTESTLLIDRTQILEVTDSYILVHDSVVQDGAKEPATAPVPA